jgi:hypothetical protein
VKEEKRDKELYKKKVLLRNQNVTGSACPTGT